MAAQKSGKVENPISSVPEASKAARTLSDPNASARARSLAGSVLANAQHQNASVNPITTPMEASKAARVLNNDNASGKSKSLAGSALANARHHSKKS